MSLKRIENFANAYRHYRRKKNSAVDSIVGIAGFAVVVCAAIGGYVVQKTGADANAYSIAGIVIAIPAIGWMVFDLLRFAKLQAETE